MLDILSALASLSPLGVIALLAYVIYLLVTQRKEAGQRHRVLASNHLHELPAMADSLRRMEATLQSMNENIVWIKARINGK